MPVPEPELGPEPELELAAVAAVFVDAAWRAKVLVAYAYTGSAYGAVAA